MTQLDEKDLKIMEALTKYGPKISTESLSQNLDIPSRTIRYRIFKLKEKGFITSIHMSTHERKLGLGECVLILNINPNYDQRVKEILDSILYFYSVTSTYGKYNGYLTRFIYSLKNPQIKAELIQLMKKNDLITDYYLFDLVDFKIKPKNLHHYDSDKGWIWDWENWYNFINTKIEAKSDFNLTFDAQPVDFDYKDIILLKNLFIDASITLKELKNLLDLSEAQISKRIQKLEKKEIIKGYQYQYSLHKKEDLLSVFCFIEISENVNNVLSCFYQLPYDLMLMYESTSKYCISLKMNSQELRNFLKGFDLIRPYLKSYFFQFGYGQSSSEIFRLYDLFNKFTDSWETPFDKYLQLFE
jgi:DNA-binding Lrp family transcriptional regulator